MLRLSAATLMRTEIAGGNVLGIGESITASLRKRSSSSAANAGNLQVLPNLDALFNARSGGYSIHRDNPQV